MTYLDSINDSLTSALRAAPELQTAPSVALGIADTATNDPSIDPATAAQSVAQVNNNAATTSSYNTAARHSPNPNLFHQAMGWLGGGLHDVKNFAGGEVSGALHDAGAPLREVQHTYRAIRDIEARHGPVAGLLEALGAAGGAAVGAYFGGSQGAGLGAAAAGGVEARLTYNGSSWRASSSGANYQPVYNRQTGQYSGTPGTVSIGRDVARQVGLKEGSKPFTIVSGLGDAISDLYLDPVANVGKLAGAARSAEGAPGLLNNIASGTRIVTPEDVDRVAAQHPLTVGRFFQQVADSSAGELASQRRMEPFAPIIPELGAAKTPEAVAQVFKDNLEAAQVTGNYNAATTVAGTALPVPTMAGAALRDASQAVQNYEGPGSNAIRSLSSFKPTNFDPDTLALSSKEFDAANPRSGRTFYQAARLGMTNRAAQAATDAFVNADTVGEKIGIYRDTMLKVMAAHGLAEDSEFAKHSLEQMLGGSAPGFDAHYAVGGTGRDISQLAPEGDKAAVAAGVLQNQTGKLAMPNFPAIVRAQRELTGWKSLYGSADDWMYNRVTQGIFKKLALLSGGFAERIAMAETIPYAAKEGFTNLVRSTVAANAAKLGYDAASADEGGLIASVVHRLGGGIERALNVPVLDNPQRIADLTDLVQANNGHIVPAAVDTTTHYSGEVGGATVKAERGVKAAMSNLPPGQTLGSNFMLFGNNDLAFDDAWQRSLSEISNDPASQLAAGQYLRVMQDGGTLEDARAAGARAAADYWRSQPPQVLQNYIRSIRPSVPGADPFEDWGKVVMENVRGATHSADIADRLGNVVDPGAPNVPLLRMIADGQQPQMSDLSGIDVADKPAMVKGRELIDIPHQNVLQRVSNFGFQRVLDPIINKLSREPLYANQFLTEYAPLRPLVEQGLLDKGDAIQLAQVRAVERTVPFIHNVMERSQFSDLSRNYMPFFFAQQQALARYGRVLAEDPGAFRQLQLMTSGLHDMAAQTKDQNGQSWMIYPGSGFLGNGTANILGRLGVPVASSAPLAFSGQTGSLNTVFPLSDVAPKFGPVVAIAGHLLENFDPAMRPAVTSVIGQAGNQGSVWDQLVPNTFIRNSIKALGNSHTRSFQSAMMSQIQALDYEQNKAVDAWNAGGQQGPKPQIVPDADAGPMAQQQFIDRVKNRTRITFMFKAFLGLTTPTAVTPDIGDMKLKGDLQAAIAKDGFAKGIDAFLAANPDATPYTVSQSDSPSGATILSSTEAENFYNANKATLDKYPYAGAWLLPQIADPKANMTIYNEQLAQGLRAKKAPDQFLNDLYIAAGNNIFYGDALPKYKDAHAQAVASGDTTQASQLSSNFGNFITNVMGPQNPVWWDDLKSATRDHERQLAVQQLQTMFATGDAPAGPQTDDVRSLLADYQRYQGAVLTGRQDSYANQSRTDMKANWQAYVDHLAIQKPQLAPLITKVFRTL